jgi:hypothetical protein
MTEPTSRFRAATPAERAQIHMMEGVPFATGHLPAQADVYGHTEPRVYNRALGATEIAEQAPMEFQRKHIKYTIRGNELHMEQEESPTALTINSRLTDEYGTLHVTDHNLNWQGATSLLAPMSHSELCRRTKRRAHTYRTTGADQGHRAYFS